MATREAEHFFYVLFLFSECVHYRVTCSYSVISASQSLEKTYVADQIPRCFVYRTSSRWFLSSHGRLD